MATMNISIPDEMKAFVEEQAAKIGFGTVSESMRVLIRGVRERQAERECVDALLLAGLDSGPATLLAPVDWESIRQEVHKRHAARQERTHGSKDSDGRQAPQAVLDIVELRRDRDRGSGPCTMVAVSESGRMEIGYPTKYGRVRAEYWPLPTQPPPAV